MRFTVVTLFPDLFESFLASSLIGKAREKGLISCDFVDPRDFTSDRHRSVDDTPYGGGAGMVLKPGPVVEALESIDGTPHKVMLTPQGERLSQGRLHTLAQKEHIVLLCGRYEGFDERIRDYVDDELSLGDYVLNGGEVAAMAIIDGVTRLVPGTIGQDASQVNDSHSVPLLEHPHYTRPADFRGAKVPEVLLSGDHQRIEAWRRTQMERRTAERRPDLWRQHSQARVDARARLGQLARRTFAVLVHYPILDRDKKVASTALTNLDLHDIARSSRSYGLGGYFVVTPVESQQQLAQRIVGHWQEGHGASHNPDRREALSLVRIAGSIEQVMVDLEAEFGQSPELVVTSARAQGEVLSYRKFTDSRADRGAPVMLLFGTGWGLAPQVMEMATVCLPPIQAASDYNHLSVRSAAAITLDRLFGMGD